MQFHYKLSQKIYRKKKRKKNANETQTHTAISIFNAGFEIELGCMGLGGFITH